jgi:hypothetical protein
LREIRREIEICDQMRGLGSLYSELDGPDHSKMIVSNGWDEDSGRFGTKNRISCDLVHESVFCRKSIDRFISQTIYLNSRSIDLFLCRSIYLNSKSIDLFLHYKIID